MRILIFVRHGQSEANVAHILSDDLNANPLTKLGVSQAEKAALELKRLPAINGFYTSPVLRAVQTAGIISRQVSVEPKIDQRLKERSFGAFNNKKFGSAAEMEKQVISEALTHYGGGMENWEALKQRVSDFIDGAHDTQLTVAVSHRDTIAAALAVMEAKYDDDPSLALNIPTASITAIDIKRKKILSIGSDTLPLGL